MATEYIVIVGRVVTNASGFCMSYSWDGDRHAKRKDAISDGFTVAGSDDFNVGVVKDGRLISLDWMDQAVDTDPQLLAKISEEIGL